MPATFMKVAENPSDTVQEVFTLHEENKFS